jgi:hypothetical protein
MRQIVRAVVGLLLAAVLVGCGHKRSGEVSGKITYNGQAVNDAALLLYPVGGDTAAPPITIPVTADGSFRISDLPKGEYKIVVQGAEGGGGDASLLAQAPPDRQEELRKKLEGRAGPKTIAFPDRYKDLSTTDLKCEITDRKQTLHLELKDE